MSVNLDEEIENAKESIEEAKHTLLASGITAEQMEQLGKFVGASILLIQYGILKGGKAITSESAFQPGEFQTKVL
jgi:hypothetical protein